MAVLKPLKVVIENYPEGQIEELDAVNHPDDPAAGTRKIKFGRELYHRAGRFSWRTRRRNSSACRPAAEVRLRYAYFITCREVMKNAAGEVVELRCTYDPATKGGNAPDGRKVEGDHPLGVGRACDCRRSAAVQSAVHQARSDGGENFAADLNPNSLEVLAGARLEPALADAKLEAPVQFERNGYFCRRPRLRSRANRCSSAPSACATPSPRMWRRRRRRASGRSTIKRGAAAASRLKYQTRRRAMREQASRTVGQPPLGGADPAAPCHHDAFRLDGPVSRVMGRSSEILNSSVV